MFSLTKKLFTKPVVTLLVSLTIPFYVFAGKGKLIILPPNLLPKNISISKIKVPTDTKLHCRTYAEKTGIYINPPMTPAEIEKMIKEGKMFCMPVLDKSLLQEKGSYATFSVNLHTAKFLYFLSDTKASVSAENQSSFTFKETKPFPKNSITPSTSPGVKRPSDFGRGCIKVGRAVVDREPGC